MMNYLDCFSSGVREMPRFMGVAGAVIRQVEDLQSVVRRLGFSFLWLGLGWGFRGLVGWRMKIIGF